MQGNLLVVPVGDSFLYFEPVYLRANGSGQSFPELKKVILADSAQVVYADNLQQALDALTGNASQVTGSQPPVTSGTTNKNLTSLANQAFQHYQAAQARLKAGDLSGYASEMQTVGQLLQQMQSGGSPSPSPSPSASP